MLGLRFCAGAETTPTEDGANEQPSGNAMEESKNIRRDISFMTALSIGPSPRHGLETWRWTGDLVTLEPVVDPRREAYETASPPRGRARAAIVDVRRVRGIVAVI